jgi:glycosyltransferase involved in cell wall biosynthesis
MKILQVTNFFKPSWESGGPARVAYELSKKLVERGHDVTVYTTDGFKSRLDVEKNKPVDVDGIKTYYFRNLSSHLAREMVLPIPYFLSRVARKEIRDFDVIHIHEHRTILAVVVCHYAKKYGTPYVLHGHGSISRGNSRKRLKRIFDILFGYNIIRDATKLIAVSNEEGEHYKQTGANDEKIFVVNNGMDIESCKNLPEYGRFRKKYGINGTMILYLGRIHKSKGIDFVITGFSNLINEISDVIFVIAGSDDGYKAELEKLIEKLNLSDKVKFTGFVDEKDKISTYVDADLFVHTVRYMGGVGLTPLEAILCNTPVIVTEECGEVIKEANCGYLVEYGDVNDLKEKMKRVIENPEEGKEMVERGKKYIGENLTWDKVVRRVEVVYEDCIHHI